MHGAQPLPAGLTRALPADEQPVEVPSMPGLPVPVPPMPACGSQPPAAVPLVDLAAVLSV